jgi:hypothetical protein
VRQGADPDLVVDDNPAAYHSDMDHGLTTRRLVSELGPALLRLAVDGSAADEPLTGVSVHDPAVPEQPESGCLVLGIGVAAGDVAALRERVGQAGARALAVKGPVPEGLPGGAVPIIEVDPRAAWLHVATTIRERLLEHSRAELRPAGRHSDLFALANTISTMLGAAVTIEDGSSAVLAWSRGQRDTDEARVEAILGRSVNRRWLDELQARGVFAQLHASSTPVFVEPIAPGMLPRVAIAVRAGAEVLGYVWAVVGEPLSDELSRQLEQLVPIVALHLSSTRVESTWARQQRGELASAVLAGGPAAVDAAQQLGLGNGPLCVLAATARASGPDDARTVGDEASAAIGLRRFEDILMLHLAAVHPSAVTVRGSRTVYALTAWPRATPRQALDSARHLARDFLTRSSVGFGQVIAVGGPAESLAHVPRARAQADAALRALRHRLAPDPVATLDEVALPVMLLHLADVSDSLDLPAVSGPLRVLAEHDGADRVLSHTLAVYLDAGGVADAAAARLRIHVNTLRYRLRRIREISGLDFVDADAMLLAHLQLRLNAVRAAVLDAGDNGRRSFSS